ncbi:ABC transporter permease subunit [Gluconacetobacter azotocaptans]|nr:ABC transporter permease subunit [Gluconacetobacter azotocaptans]
MRRTPGTIRILGGILTLYLLAPFAAGLSRMGDADWRGVDRAALLHAAGVSVASATAATALVAVAGIPLGYVLAHGRGWRMAVLGGVVQLPLALPPLASGILLLFLLGYGGLLGGLMHGALTESFAGIVLAEAFVAAPFLIVAARSAFAAIDPALEDVAATLGHGPGAVFRRIGLPLARRAILAGLLLAWLRAFGEFGATMMVAYHPYSLPVFTYVAFGGAGLPAMLPVLAPTLAVAALVLVLGQVVAAPRRGGGGRFFGCPAPCRSRPGGHGAGAGPGAGPAPVSGGFRLAGGIPHPGPAAGHSWRLGLGQVHEPAHHRGAGARGGFGRAVRWPRSGCTAARGARHRLCPAGIRPAAASDGGPAGGFRGGQRPGAGGALDGGVRAGGTVAPLPA